MSDPNLTFYHNFAVDQSLAARIGPTLGITRETSTTFFNSSGLIETAAPGIAKFEYDPITRISLGLLVEEARTNIALQSEDFSIGANWTEGSNTLAIVGNETTAPDGATTADKLIDNSGTGTGDVFVLQTITLATSTVYAISVDAKADQLDFLRIRVVNLGALAISAFFDLTNGVVGATKGANNTSEFIEDVGDGWFPCGIVFTSDASDISGQFRIKVAQADNDDLVDLDGTSSIFLWGATIEAGAFPTSYIPTTTATATRNADVVSTTDVSWLNASAGTFYADFSTGNIDNDTTVFSIHDGTTNERIAVEITGGNIHFIGVDTTTQWDISTAATADTDYKLAVAWAANDIAFYLNGSQIGVDGLATLPTLTALNIGSDHADAEFLNSHFREGRGYNVRKDNTFLEGLSNGIINEDSSNLSTNLTRPIVRKLARPY